MRAGLVVVAGNGDPGWPRTRQAQTAGIHAAGDRLGQCQWGDLDQQPRSLNGISRHRVGCLRIQECTLTGASWVLCSLGASPAFALNRYAIIERSERTLFKEQRLESPAVASHLLRVSARRFPNRGSLSPPEPGTRKSAWPLRPHARSKRLCSRGSA